MPSVIFSKDQLCAVQVESAFGQAPNSTGTATVANTNFCLVEKLTLNGAPALIDRPDKTGSLDYLLGAAGRRSATWSARLSLAGSGAAGTAPDAGPFLQALFGKAPTVVASTSVTYALDDLSPSISIYSFRKPGTATQQLAIGAVVDQAVFNLGADVATLDLSGTALWVLDTDQFSTADSTAKGGLTTFPSQPSSPAFNGSMIVGFKGSITLDGNVYTGSSGAGGGVTMARLTFKANREIPNDVIGSGYGSAPAQDRRDITGEIDLYEDDSATLSAFKVKAFAATSVNCIFQAGNVAGNILTLNYNNVQVTPPQYDDSAKKYKNKFTFKAHASGIQTKDSVTAVWT